MEQKENGLGLAGLIFSVLGWITCGLLSIPGVILSLAGLASDGPKGTSLAGLLLGLPGVMFLLSMIVLFFVGVMIPTGQGIDAIKQKQAAEASAKLEP